MGNVVTPMPFYSQQGVTLYPLPIFAYFKNKNFRIVGELKNTDKMMERTFWVGVYPGLTIEMMEFVVKTIGDFLKYKNNIK